MSAPGVTSRRASRLGVRSLHLSRDRVATLLAAAALLAACIVMSRISVAFFIVSGIALAAVFAVVSWQWPRPVIVLMALAPIFDRYFISLLVPPGLDTLTNFFSEALLLFGGSVIAIRAWREGQLPQLFRDPVAPLLAGFLAVGCVSMLVNGVPPIIALAGIVFTVDAVALFVLPQLTRFETRHAIATAGAFVLLATAAALLAIGQIALSPTILGMEVSQGRFSEGHRVTAFFDGNPNMLGAVLAMALPFPAFAASHLRGRRRMIAWGVTVVIALALLYTFSRGAWLAVAVGMLFVGLILDRRALLLVVVAGVVAYGAAHVMPRNLLVGVLSSEGAAPEIDIDLGDATFGRIETIGAGRDLRFLFIQNAVPIIADHPIVGAGPGRYGGAVSARFPNSPLYDRYTDGVVPEGRTVDNFWLHLVVEFGVLGAGFFAAMLAYAILRLIWAARRADPVHGALLAAFAAAGVILAVDSLTEMLLEGNTSSFSMWLFLGIGTTLLTSLRRGAIPGPTDDGKRSSPPAEGR